MPEMIEELFELLQRKGITDIASLESLVLGRYTSAQIADLDNELAELTEEHVKVPDPVEVSGFDFWPNSELSAGLGACKEISCRVNRMQHLTRFALMWADSVYLPPFFGILHEEEDEFFRRDWLVGSLKAVLLAEPAIRAGIVRLSNRSYHFCQSCGAHIKETEQLVEEAKRSIHDTYNGKVLVEFENKSPFYLTTVTGPEDLLPHGAICFLSSPHAELPAWLPQRVRKNAEAGKAVIYKVPKTKLHDSKALEAVIDRVAEDIFHQYLACQVHGTKYLTHRQVDAAFLTARSRPVKWCKSAPPSQFSQRDAAGRSTTSFRSGNSPVVASSPANPPTLR